MLLASPGFNVFGPVKRRVDLSCSRKLRTPTMHIHIIPRAPPTMPLGEDTPHPHLQLCVCNKPKHHCTISVHVRKYHGTALSDLTADFRRRVFLCFSFVLFCDMKICIVLCRGLLFSLVDDLIQILRKSQGYAAYLFGYLLPKRHESWGCLT